LVVRACDTRITPWNAAIVAEDAMDARDLDHPGRVLPHVVTVDARLLRRLCGPVEVEYGTTVKELGELVGAKPQALHYRRYRKAFETHYIPAARGPGNVKAVFSSDRALDPGAHLFAGPDEAWCGTANGLVDRIPEGFSQEVMRVPVYRGRTLHFEKEHLHPEHPKNDVALRADRYARSVRLPKPPPDPVWYKWKGDVFVGYDWRRPGAEAAYLRRQRRLELGRAANRRNRKYVSRAKGSVRFWGWAWVCPGCKKPAKNLYLPLPFVCLLPRLGGVVSGKLERVIKGLHMTPQSLPALACLRCHDVHHLSRAKASSWNHLIAYLTGGLLYGREVRRPEGFHVRKRAYRPVTSRGAPRREQVRRRLLNGWSIKKICGDLGMSIFSLGYHVRAICRQEGVGDRHELAKKLGSRHAQPLTQNERAWERRGRVMELLLAGKTYREIMAALSVDFVTVNRDTQAIYRRHGVHGAGRWCRERLAVKLGSELPAGGVHLRCDR
jgi:DNA-binding NarL/FixJ family response regulator